MTKTEMTDSHLSNSTKVQMIAEINEALTERYDGIPTQLTSRVASLPRATIAPLHYFLYIWRNDEWTGEKCSLFDGYCQDAMDAEKRAKAA